MALVIPESLHNLNANCGVFSVWMVLRHHGIHLDIDDLRRLCHHDNIEGTFSIALAVAMKRIGFDVSFYTDPDLHVDSAEQLIYEEAFSLKIPINSSLSYSEILNAVSAGYFAIVAYEHLDGTAYQSLVYTVDDESIYFFDNFAVMTKVLFEQQRQVEGICRQVILIHEEAEQVFHSLKFS